MQTIIPAIIPGSRDDLEYTLSRVRPFAREVQIDIVDGVFVPYTSWPYLGSGSVHTLARLTEEFALEVDLMIMEPEKVVDVYARAGVARIVAHLEAINDLEALFAHHEAHTYLLGLSILNDTSFALLRPHLERIDFVQFMGIDQIGSQGQPFDERVIEHIRMLREIDPEMPISIDGSVNRATLPKLLEAGANRFIAGSAILAADDPLAAYEELTRLTE